SPLLTLLAWGTLFNALMHLPYMLQLAYGWPEFAVKVNFIAILILTPTLIILVPLYGVIGAAWIWLVLNVGYVLLSIHFMHHKLIPNQKWVWYVKDIFLPDRKSTRLNSSHVK